MKLFGTVTFTERGRTYEWSSREEPPSTVEHPFELRDDGIVIPMLVGSELVGWDAVEELRGWSPVGEADRSRAHRTPDPVPEGGSGGERSSSGERMPHGTPQRPARPAVRRSHE